MRNKLKNLVKDTVWFAIGNFGSKIISFLLVPLYTNILTTEEYGKIDIITTTISILVPIFTFAIQDGAFRFTLDCDEDKYEIFSGSVTITVFSLLLLFLFLPLFKLFMPGFSEYSVYFCLLYILTALTGVISYFTKGLGRNKLFAFNGIFTSISLSIFNILFLVVIKLRIYGYLLSLVLSNAMSIALFVLIGKLGHYYSIKKININQIKRIIKYSIPLIPATIAWLVMVSIDKYMLYYMEGVESNGLYSIAHKIPSLCATVMALFINAWQITAVKFRDDKDSSDFTSFVFNVLYLVGYFLTYIIVILSEPIARLLFSKDFYSAWILTPCLTVATILSVYSNFIGGVFTAYKRSDLHLKSNIIALAVNIILNYLLIKMIGFQGVSIATMISFYIVFIYRNVKVKTLENISYSRVKMYFGIAILMGSAILATFGLEYYYLICFVGFDISLVLYISEIISIFARVKNLIINRKRGRIDK